MSRCIRHRKDSFTLVMDGKKGAIIQSWPPKPIAHKQHQMERERREPHKASHWWFESALMINSE
jgi:hypothetical protein